MNLTKALADETRVRILLALRDGELCVCQITGLFELAPSTVSKHLSILYQAGLVDSRKEGRWMYYRWPQQSAPAVRAAIRWVEVALADNPRIAADHQRLGKLLKLDPADLCKRSCQK